MVYAACLWSCGQGGLTLPNTAFYLDPARRAQLEAFESTVAEARTTLLLSSLSPVHGESEYPEPLSNLSPL